MNISALPPLPVVVPLLMAAGIAALSGVLRRRTVEALSVAAAAATATLSAVLWAKATAQPLVYWFAGWHPARGLALGISFTVDPFGAGLATLVAVLVMAAFVFSIHYFEEIESHRFHIMMLVFLGGMVGFSLTGDLFNLFVFFELMSVAGYGLTGMEVLQPAPLQGAINFAVENSVGAFLMLWGIALLYARTGALNMAQMGQSLAGHPPDGLVVVAFALVMAGLFVKAAVAPFHFWLPDAHAVAPTPVCVLFSGAMVELGLYGAARVYWTVFDGSFSPVVGGLSKVLVGFGVVTALVGAVMCFAQQHLKRLLAFSTVAHVGLFLVGVGAFDHVALAGVAVYVLAHGLVKASLFLCAGIVLHRLGSIDEEALRGAGKVIPLVGILFALGGLGLAEVPPFGTAIGKALLEDGAKTAGYAWAPWLFGLVAAVTGGAVLRAAGRVFVGWGPKEPDRFASERLGELTMRETEDATGRTPSTMFVPAVLLLAGALALGLIPGLARGAERAAALFEDRSGYAVRVLQGRTVPAPAVAVVRPTAAGLSLGVVSGAAAAGLAGLALFRRRLFPGDLRRGFSATAGRGLTSFRSLQSGHVGDYVAWLVVGVAGMGGLFALVLR